MGRKGRLTAILLVMALTLGSCTFEPGEEESSALVPPSESSSRKPLPSGDPEESKEREGFALVDHPAWTTSPHYAYREQNSSYEALWSQAQRDCYQKLVESVYWIDGEADKDGLYPVRAFSVLGTRLSEEEIRAAVTAFKDDHPQIFWLSNSYSYSWGGEQGEGTYIQLYSYLSPQQCEQSLQQLQEQAEKCISQLSPDMTEYQRERAIHDFVASRCTYDDEALAHAEDWKGWWQTFTAYGALVEGKAVCEGYARAVQLLLSYAGMQSALVRGVSDNQRHMWNLVQVEGDWYHLDATWNDSRDQGEYFYFNLSDKQISADHQMDPPASSITQKQWEQTGEKPLLYNLFRPECTSTGQNYFNKEGFHLDSFDKESDELAVEALKAAVNQGKTTFPILIGEGMDYNEAISQLLKGAPYKFFYYQEQLNDSLPPNRQIDANRVRYVEAQSQRAVVVYLSQ